jgi:hypothetical protein
MERADVAHCSVKVHVLRKNLMRQVRYTVHPNSSAGYIVKTKSKIKVCLIFVFFFYIEHEKTTMTVFNQLVPRSLGTLFFKL